MVALGQREALSTGETAKVTHIVVFTAVIDGKQCLISERIRNMRPGLQRTDYARAAEAQWRQKNPEKSDVALQLDELIVVTDGFKYGLEAGPVRPNTWYYSGNR